MYFVTNKTVEIENEAHELFGISDGINEYACFTSDKEEAERLAALLNENNVEQNHVNDVIEDMFYT